MAKIPQPVILGGDFNAAPWSHSVSKLAKVTKTSLLPGLRFAHSIRVIRGLPKVALPIDHILLPEGAKGSAKVGPFIGSDHYPVIATFHF